MKFTGPVIAVSNVHKSRKFYEDLFGLELYQNYGINIVFTCGLSLQQEFHWMVGVPAESVLKQSHNMELYFEEEDFDGFLKKLAGYPEVRLLGEVVEQSWGQRTVHLYDPDGHIIDVGESMKMVIQRFLSAGMTMEEVSKKMDASVEDLQKLLND